MVSCSYTRCVEYRSDDMTTGVIPQLQKGDVLGHECCGVVESVGPEANKVKVGDRVVVSFPIACGDCMNCRKELFSQCERTNENTVENALYGKRTAGMSQKFKLVMY